MGEIWPVCEKLRWTIASGERHLRPESVSSGLLPHKQARLEYHPLGVVGAIIPWNYPLQNIMNPPDPGPDGRQRGGDQAFGVGRVVGRAHRRDRARRAGRRGLHDPDLVQLVQGYAETGEALIEGGIDSLVFIGSVDNGRRVLASRGQRVDAGGARARRQGSVHRLRRRRPRAGGPCRDGRAASSTPGRTASRPSACWCSTRSTIAFARRVGRAGASAAPGRPAATAWSTSARWSRRCSSTSSSGWSRDAVEQGRARARRAASACRPSDGRLLRAHRARRRHARDGHHAGGDLRPGDAAVPRTTTSTRRCTIANGTGFGLGSSVFSRDHARARRIADRAAGRHDRDQRLRRHDLHGPGSDLRRRQGSRASGA